MSRGSRRNVLVLGGGAIARRGHLPALRQLERAGLLVLGGVVEPDPEAAKTVHDELGARVFPTLDDALAAGSYDLWDVCTPSSLHLDAIARGFAAGVPLLVEKPLVLGLEQIGRLAALVAPGTHPFVGVVQNYRYYRCVERALERVARGAMGRVTSLTGFAPTRFPVSWTRSTWLYEQGGVLLDFAPHALDLFVLFAAAPARRVVAFGHDVSGGAMGFSNYCQIMVEFEGGVLASLDASWVTGSNMFSVGVHGTSGHIDLDVRNDYYREYHGTYTPFDDLRDLRGRAGATLRRLISGEYFRGPMVFYDALLRDFLASVDAGRATSPRVCTLAQGLNCAAVLVTALESVARGTVLDVDASLGAAAAGTVRGLYEAA